jgi:transcriptional regulator with XRE-family HTH domain
MEAQVAEVPSPGPDIPVELHQIQLTRQREEKSLKAVARHLGLSPADAHDQEDPRTDLKLSQLYRWAAVLEVPPQELLNRDDSSIELASQRGALVRMMKTIQMLLQAVSSNERLRIIAETLYEQLISIMPELHDVTPYPTASGRRMLTEASPREIHPVCVPADLQPWAADVEKNPRPHEPVR